MQPTAQAEGKSFRFGARCSRTSARFTVCWETSDSYQGSPSGVP